MNCVQCAFKHRCRTNLESCPPSKPNRDEVLDFYHEGDHQQVVQAAAHLVDGGRAGTLNRLQEIIEYTRELGYRRLGLAYCYGMEADALKIVKILRNADVWVSATSCTTGGVAQNQVNDESELTGVSCNPAGQGAQLSAEKVDFVVTMGPCLGHDLLLQEQLDVPISVLVVKDRTSAHNPLQAVRDMYEQEFGESE